MLNQITMSNYTVPYSSQIECAQSNATIRPPPFLPVANSTASLCAISNYVPNVEALLSSCCDANATTSSSTHSQVLTSGYDDSGCAWRYCNITEKSSASAFESCVSRNSAAKVEGKCFAANTKDVTSDASSSGWRLGKKKEKTTVSAGLLVALGIAGLVIG
jgi:hypothetical protein